MARTTTAPLASSRQVDFIMKLAQAITELDPQSSAATLTRDMASQFNRAAASAVITGMIESRDQLQADQRKATRDQVERKLEAEGFYRLDGEVYRVRRAVQSGRLYALRLVDNSERVELAYAPGVLTRLAPEHQMSADEAMELAEYIGRSTGQCIVCGRKLTTTKSREAGIGPVCRKRV